MPRITKLAWWCPRGHKNTPSDRLCVVCQHSRIERHAQIHASDRAVVFYNPHTGEHRTPPRADAPLPEVYAKQGFERHEIMSMSEWERKTGTVHEATNFSPGNEPSPELNPTPTCPREVKEALIKDMADAFASGPWTGGLPDHV